MFNRRCTKNLNACRSKSESISKTNFSVSPILQEVFPLKRMSLSEGKLNRHTLPLSSSYYPAGIYQAVPGRSYSTGASGEPAAHRVSSLLWNAQHPRKIQKEEKT